MADSVRELEAPPLRPSRTDSRRDSRLEHLIRVTPSLVSEPNLGRVLQQVTDLARDLLNAKYAAIGLLSPDQQTLASFAASGTAGPPVGRDSLGVVIREGQVVRRQDGFSPRQSFLGVPVAGGDGIIGALYLTGKQGAAGFDDADARMASLLALFVSEAVESASARERTLHLMEEAQELHRSRQRFVAMVNHDLRNALAGAFGWAELLVRQRGRAVLHPGIDNILEATAEAVALLEDLMDLSRMDEERLKLVFRQVDCGLVACAVTRRLTPLAEKKQVRLIAPPVRDPQVCQTDPHRVDQILANLVTNAIRHAPAESPVVVRVERRADAMLVSVADDGPGVAPDMVDQIFEMYCTTVPEGETAGHGVGLSLSRRLARLLGGDVRAVARPGQGGLFELKLPLVTP